MFELSVSFSQIWCTALCCYKQSAQASNYIVYSTITLQPSLFETSSGVQMQTRASCFSVSQFSSSHSRSESMSAFTDHRWVGWRVQDSCALPECVSQVSQQASRLLGPTISTCIRIITRSQMRLDNTRNRVAHNNLLTRRNAVAD